MPKAFGRKMRLRLLGSLCLLWSAEAFSLAPRMPRRSWRLRESSLDTEAGASRTELPDSFEDALEEMVESTVSAFQSGVSCMTIEFDSSGGDATYTTLKNSVPLAQGLLVGLVNGLGIMPPPEALAEVNDEEEEKPAPTFDQTVAIYFPDEGAAALARQEWKLVKSKKKKKPADDDEEEEEEDTTPLVPQNVRVKGLPRVVGEELVGPPPIKSSDAALVLLCPRAEDLSAIEKIYQAAQGAATPVVMINPNLIDMGTTGFGYAGRLVRERLIDNFTIVYQLRTTDWGCLTRRFGFPFSAWVIDDSPEGQAAGGYRLLVSRGSRISGTEVEELLAEEEQQSDGEAGGNPFKGLGKFISDFGKL
uniref:DUF1995 domain-containing protein n=1 Tax=Pinguiococcus pyrenoidosus TaxID=172671 RepID=A0A7R9U859_9STRA